MARKRKQPGNTALPPDLRPVAKELALRTVRPRPLRYEEKLRVLWPGNIELEKIDGGAFAKWLRETEVARLSGDLSAVGSCQAQVVLVGNTVDVKTLKRGHEEQPQPIVMGTASMLAEKLGGRTIKVPQFRLLPKREWLQEPAAEGLEGPSVAGEEAAYFRHRDVTQDEADQKVEYDLDSEDEEWLVKRNKKVHILPADLPGPSMAWHLAVSNPVQQAVRKSIRLSEGQLQGGAQELSENDFERLIDAFEKAKHAELGRQQANFTSTGSSSKAVLPEEQAPAEIFPAAKAIEEFGEGFSSLTVRAVHNYWAKKAAASKLPLLQRFWYDKPWARSLARAQTSGWESDSGSDDGIPFQGKDSPRPHARGRAIDIEEVDDRLYAARQDLERLRTIADRVRRREKVKKRHLLDWRREWQERVFLAHKRKPKVQKKSLKEAVSKKLAGRQKAPVQPAVTAKLGGQKGSRKPAVVARGSPVRAQPGQTKLPEVSNGKRQTSLGGGIVSAVVDQLRRLGTWGRAEESPKSTPSTALAASGFNPLDSKDIDKASRGNQGLLAAPMTRHQEQAVLDAAIELSLEDQRGGPKPKAMQRKQVRFAQSEAAPNALQQSCKETLHVWPAGFEAKLRAPAGKRRGMQLRATCKHGSFDFGHPAKLPAFFAEHSSCRPSWRAFKQLPEESNNAYKARLRVAFPFAVSSFSMGSDALLRPVSEPSKAEKVVHSHPLTGFEGRKTEHRLAPQSTKGADAAHLISPSRATGIRSPRKRRVPMTQSIPPSKAASQRPAKRRRATAGETAAVQSEAVGGGKSPSRRSSRKGRDAEQKEKLTAHRQLQPRCLPSPKSPITDSRKTRGCSVGSRSGSAPLQAASLSSSTTMAAGSEILLSTASCMRNQVLTAANCRLEESASELGEPDDVPAIAASSQPELQTSSSGSDTCLAAASEEDSEDLIHAHQPPSSRNGMRLTRRNGRVVDRVQLHLPKVPLEWKGRTVAQEAPSDVSSFSEGSGPSFFAERGETATGPRRQVRTLARSKTQASLAKKGRLVAAARQRLKRATSWR